jgi:hypothetical protein
VLGEKGAEISWIPFSEMEITKTTLHWAALREGASPGT